MLENVFSEKWPFSELQKNHGLHDDLKIIWKNLTPGRYRVPKFVPTKKMVSQ